MKKILLVSLFALSGISFTMEKAPEGVDADVYVRWYKRQFIAWRERPDLLLGLAVREPRLPASEVAAFISMGANVNKPASDGDLSFKAPLVELVDNCHKYPDNKAKEAREKARLLAAAGAQDLERAELRTWGQGTEKSACRQIHREIAATLKKARAVEYEQKQVQQRAARLGDMMRLYPLDDSMDYPS